jgi:hypothetical protein
MPLRHPTSRLPGLVTTAQIVRSPRGTRRAGNPESPLQSGKSDLSDRGLVERSVTAGALNPMSVRHEPAGSPTLVKRIYDLLNVEHDMDDVSNLAFRLRRGTQPGGLPPATSTTNPPRRIHHDQQPAERRISSRAKKT